MDIIQSGKGRGVYSSSSKFNLVATMKIQKGNQGTNCARQYINNIKRKYNNSIYIVDRVVGTSKFQTAQPDALFVVFLGTKWAYDYAKKNDHEFMGTFGPEIWAILRWKTAPNERNFLIWLKTHTKVINA